MPPPNSTASTLDPFPLIGSWLGASASSWPDDVAIEFGDDRVTYAALESQSLDFAHGLWNKGVRPGDVVATLSENRPEHVALFFACARAGFIFCPLNWRLSTTELLAQVAHLSPRALVTSTRWHSHLAATNDSFFTPRVTFDDLGDETRRTTWPTPSPDSGVLLIATSGSTGRPKGVLLSHANCFWTNASLEQIAPIQRADHVLQVLPQFHVGGWNVQPLLAWRRGACVILEPEFDVDRVLDLIGAGRVHTMMGVPTTYLMLSQSPRFASTQLSGLREVMVGGAVMPSDVATRWTSRGVRLFQGYGLSEAAPNVCCLLPEEAPAHSGSVGRPYPHVEVALLDAGTNEFVAGEGQGELCVKGPNTFLGYWRDPDATADVYLDQWLRTGDVAHRDHDGYLRIIGRIKEMYVSGGENVYPSEVERVMSAHPSVLEVAVISVDDEHWGEVGVAYIVSDPKLTFGLDDAREWCRGHLARYKVPHHFFFVESLARTAIGKPDRPYLTRHAQDEIARANSTKG